MGKKTKKETEAPPKDVFDTLAVESKKAATVVLMLESPEEEILIKGCEALYKFAEKCDENRGMLLEHGAGEHLLKLIVIRGEDCP
nr:armadillo repeat-containing protein 3-like [Lytechinus pictus]